VKLVVAPRDGVPPFEPDLIAFEMDVDLILRMDREPAQPSESAPELVAAMSGPAAHALGDVLWLSGEPTQALLMVHDLDRDPSWDEAWIDAALDSLLAGMAERCLERLALPVLGTVHGRLDPARFPDLLGAALGRAEIPPEAVWVITSDPATNAAMRARMEAVG